MAYNVFSLWQEYQMPDVKDRQHLIILHKRARKVGLDLERYNQLKDSVSQIEADIKRLRDPLHLHLPVSHQTSDRCRTPLQRAQQQLRYLLNKTKTAS
jgi:exonuclease VII small subunit